MEVFMKLKGKSLRKCAVMTISCPEIYYHILVSTSFFCFHSYFGGPFDLILSWSAVV